MLRCAPLEPIDCLTALGAAGAGATRFAGHRSTLERLDGTGQRLRAATWRLRRWETACQFLGETLMNQGPRRRRAAIEFACEGCGTHVVDWLQDTVPASHMCGDCGRLCESVLDPDEFWQAYQLRRHPRRATFRRKRVSAP
jgi:hypothetical protein